MAELVDFEQLGPEGHRVAGPEQVDLKKKYVYFGNRLCPFAHRAFWTLHEKGAINEMDYIHVDLGDAKPAWYKEKFNPAGTVPALYVDGRAVFESAPIVEFMDEHFAGQGEALLPADLVDRAAARAFVSDLNVAPLYGLLMEQDAAAQPAKAAAADALLDKLEAKYAAQTPAGPFFLGERPCVADVAVMPFLDRFSVLLPHYRAYDVFAGRPRLRAALEAAKKRPAFAATSQEPEYYINAYSGYATGKPGVPAKVAKKSEQ